jgi:hypothetical protein
LRCRLRLSDCGDDFVHVFVVEGSLEAVDFALVGLLHLLLALDVFNVLCRCSSHGLIPLLLLDACLGLVFGELAEAGFSDLLLDTDSLGFFGGLNLSVVGPQDCGGCKNFF